MARRFVTLALILTLVAVALAGLAALSRRTTHLRVFGAYPVPEAEIQLQVVDGAGEPLPATLHVLADGAPSTDFPIPEYSSASGLASDAAGRFVLHQEPRPFEYEEWRLLWLFRRRSVALPQMEVELRAPGYAPLRVPLHTLTDEEPTGSQARMETMEGEREVPIFAPTLTLQPAGS